MGYGYGREDSDEDLSEWRKYCEEENRKQISDLCNALCGVLYQSYSCMSEEDNGEYRTTYNYDAIAVDLLEKHGYVEIIDGKWPRTKYLTFKFTEKVQG